MVANNYAWAYEKYSKDYINLEKEARDKKLGIWRSKKPIPPWEFRKHP
ncbi:thermonuclease family protein [Campylobacter mucosalis]|nr:thermonuclease family protein [Campylobacter mucosalis]